MVIIRILFAQFPSVCLCSEHIYSNPVQIIQKLMSLCKQNMKVHCFHKNTFILMIKRYAARKVWFAAQFGSICVCLMN